MVKTMPVINHKDKQACERYNQFIETARFSSITQETDWGHVKNNWEPLYVYLEEAGEIVAAMSILTIQNMGEESFAYAAKGPVMNEVSIAYIERLVEEAEAELAKRKVFLLRMDPEFPYSEELNLALKQTNLLVRNREVAGKETIQPRYNMLLELRGRTEEEILSSFYGKTRYRIRYAQKKGLTSRGSSDWEDLALFYTLYETTSRRHGISYRPRNYFIRLAESFLDSGKMKIILILIDGVPDAGGLCFLSGNKVWYMYAGSTHENQVLMAPYLMNWEGIKWALAEGKEAYDFGGVFDLTNEDGLYQFKHGFIRPGQPTEYIGELDKVYNQEVYQRFIAK
ncbi:lipid II:glycine glycyltransferase FemX [Enterococcus sp. LJL128]